MGHSRITLATLFALGLLGAVQAQDPVRDPFFVELKGPDEPAAPTLNRQPLLEPVASSSVGPTVQPPARQVAIANVGSYGPIRPTDTLWSLANKYRPSSQVSVYQTMVAIYQKNPRSFADGNINHILVGSRIMLPTVGEASVISDAQARAKFRNDNASWKGLSPKYVANKQSPVTKPAAAKPAKVEAAKTEPVKAAPAPLPVAKAAPIPAPVVAPQPAAETKEVAKVNEPAPKEVIAPAPSAAEGSTPAPLPSDLDKPAGKPATEMTLALEDANAQLAQVSEMNHRLKLRLQSLTDEVETLKAQLVDQTALQKEIAELKAQPIPPVVAEPDIKQNWLMSQLSSPLNLAMVLLLPVLLVLALVMLWLRARARREMEQQEQSLSESTAMMMDQEQNEFDQLLSVAVTDHDSGRSPSGLESTAGMMHEATTAGIARQEMDLVFHDEGLDEREEGEHPASPAFDLAKEVESARNPQEMITEEQRQAALFAELEMDLAGDRGSAERGFDNADSDDLTRYDLDSFDVGMAQPELAKSDNTIDLSLARQDDIPAELRFQGEPVSLAELTPSWDPNELVLSDDEDNVDQDATRSANIRPREQAQGSDYVEIDTLLADADATTPEQEPYQGLSLDVGLDGFPEVLPESAGFDVDLDDGGVGAKLDLARAYLEIDDKASARELLQEAAVQGTQYQRSEAEKLLKRLG